MEKSARKFIKGKLRRWFEEKDGNKLQNSNCGIIMLLLNVDIFFYKNVKHQFRYKDNKKV